MRGRTIIPFFPFLFLLSWLSYRYFFWGGRRGSGSGAWSLESVVWGLGSGEEEGEGWVVSHLCVPLRRIFGFFSYIVF